MDAAASDRGAVAREARYVGGMKAFEARYWEMRRAGTDPARAGFTAEMVEGYVLATAEHVTYPGVRPSELLSMFPRGWWWPAMEVILHGERRPGRWKSDREYVEALAEAEPEHFAHDPLALVARGIHNDRFHRTHRATVTPPLLAALADEACPYREQVAVLLLMLSSEHVPAIERALASDVVEGWGLAHAGYACEDGRLRPLFGDAAFELAYPDGYFATEAHPRPRAPRAPGAPSHTLGGRVDALADDGSVVRMHHALTLDPVPPGLGVTLRRLVLGFDLAALAYEGVEHFYAHDDEGRLRADDERAEPDGVAEEAVHPALVETRVQLVPIDGEARHRTWGDGPGARCDRLGGHAIFVQDDVYPTCPGCHRHMAHLLSLDSGLPLDGPDANGRRELDWGSGGVANAFWCDPCRRSAWSWACT